MFLKYLLGGFFAGLVAAGATLIWGAPAATVGAAFVLGSQLLFWAGLSISVAGRSMLRQLIGRRQDADYIKEPGHLQVTGALGRPDLRCLIVDDDPIFLEIMEETLRQLGYRRITACLSADEALSKIAITAVPFDCCFLDIEMPVLDGVALCRMIRATPGYEHTPLVMVTARHGREHVKNAFREGATDYITKPFDAADLASRLSAIEVATQRRDPSGMDTRLVSLASIENYLMQLERGGAFSGTALAFRLNGRQNELSPNSITDPGELLREASACLMTALQAHDALLSYAGEGVFVAIISSRQVDIEAIVRRIAKAEAARSLLKHPHFHRSISVGTPVVIQSEEADGNSVFLLHSAIHAVEEDLQVFVA